MIVKHQLFSIKKNFETDFPPIHQFKNPKWSFEEVHKDRIFSNPKLMITLKALAELHLFYYKKKGFLAQVSPPSMRHVHSFLKSNIIMRSHQKRVLNSVGIWVEFMLRFEFPTFDVSVKRYLARSLRRSWFSN